MRHFWNRINCSQNKNIKYLKKMLGLKKNRNNIYLFNLLNIQNFYKIFAN